MEFLVCLLGFRILVRSSKYEQSSDQEMELSSGEILESANLTAIVPHSAVYSKAKRAC